MSACRVCSAEPVRLLLDCGPQPVANRFLHRSDEPQRLHPLQLGVCDSCAVVQLLNPLPGSEVTPPFDWITYNEPEGHLDDLAGRLAGLSGVHPGTLFRGVSYKEDTTFARLARAGFSRHHRLQAEGDLGIKAPGAGIEMIQSALTAFRAATSAKKDGRAAVVLARHILEHAERPREFVRALEALADDDGRLVFEVPDCTRALELGDYTTLWEEHLVYFTPVTFRHSLACLGREVEEFLLYPYPTENSLVAITRPASGRAVGEDAELLAAERARAEQFAAGFAGWREKLASWLRDFRRTRGRIAVFGAGHMSCMFIQLLEVADCLEFVVDDHPRKKGMFLPGSALPIVGSERLLADDIKLCLSSLAPESEAKVLARQQEFLRRGGIFASIFPGKANSLAPE